MLTDYLDKYPVLLDGKKDSKKIQIYKKMQMKLGATQTEPYLALCHKVKKNCKKFQKLKKMQIKLGATQTEPYLALCLKCLQNGIKTLWSQ